MPSSKDVGGNRRSGSTTKKNAFCSFCRKSYRDVGPLVEGPGDVYICGECIDLCQSILDQEQRRRGSTKQLFSKIPTPREVVEQLDQYVIGQNVAKKVLAVAVHNHYKRLMLGWEGSEVEIDKSNILLVGPTGSGKTLLARTLARILNVPFAIGDATTLTEAGYVGEDVENLLLKLLHSADFDLEAAQRGVIYIDEIDKIGKTTQNVSITQYIQLDTTNILFICGGTFVGLEKIIGKRLGQRTIGFGQQSGVKADEDLTELLPQVTSDDILEFGLIPELVGRMPVACSLTPLCAESLVQVLTQPRNAVVKQYQSLFEMENCELSFTDDALQAIALRAKDKETGARGLRSIIEDVMLEVMYELPEQEEGGRYIINKDVVEGRNKLFPLRTPQTKSA